MGLKIKNPFKQVKQAVNLFKEPIKTIFKNPIDIINDPIGYVKESALMLPQQSMREGAMLFNEFGPAIQEGAAQVGIGQTQAKKAAQREKDAQMDADKEEAARSGAFNDALNDKGLDAITKQEIEQMYGSGLDSATISAYLSKARTGKGLFGVRSVNENQGRYQTANPGRSATLGSGGIV